MVRDILEVIESLGLKPFVSDDDGDTLIEVWCAKRKISFFGKSNYALRVWGVGTNVKMSEYDIKNIEDIKTQVSWLIEERDH